MMIKLPETVTSTMYVILRTYDNGVFSCSSSFSEQEGYTVLGQHEVTLDVPQEDPTLKAIESLENRAEDIQAEATAAVRAIMDKVQQLKCIEHKPEQDDE